MAKILKIPEFKDDRGNLFAIEKILGKDFKRVYFIKNGKGIRGGHKHKKNRQVLICLEGECTISVINSSRNKKEFLLDVPTKCLILEPSDWHEMYNFSKDAILLVIASEYYDVEDYIDSYD